jgi:hypothetical protein
MSSPARCANSTGARRTTPLVPAKVTPGLRLTCATSSAGVDGPKLRAAQSTSGVEVVCVTKEKSRMVSKGRR